MDDRRIEQALRDGPPDEPGYVAGIAEHIAVEAEPIQLDRTRTRRPTPAQRRAGGLGWLLPLAAVVTIAVAGLAIRFNEGPGATSSPTPDMLARIRAAGVVHIAVTNQTPQIPTSGGEFAGFDIDVARALARELSATSELQLVSPDSILQGTGDWELALPSVVLPSQLQGALAGAAYYEWPIWLVVESGASIVSAGDLDGARICAVEGSAGASWLAGAAVRDLTVTPATPLRPTAVGAASDEACIAALADGTADAALTATLLDTDFAVRGVRSIGAGPFMTNRHIVLIREAAGLGDPTSLQTAVDAAIHAIRASGELEELSRRAFGGADLTGALP